MLNLESLFIGDWLNGGVEMALVAFLIEDGDDFLLLVASDGLVVDGRADILVHRRVFLAVLGPGRDQLGCKEVK
jgi:hypothetical protein